MAEVNMVAPPVRTAGPIPSQLCELAQLRTFGFARNQLTGEYGWVGLYARVRTAWVGRSDCCVRMHQKLDLAP
jgi:hypothetical protein